MTLKYNSSSLSTKDRLTISNLISLFQSRLSAKWVAADQAPDQKSVDLTLIDIDRPGGREKWDGFSEDGSRVAVTANDRFDQPRYILQPIRAYGPNGVIVLFNAVAQALLSGGSDKPSREPTRIRMSGLLETQPAPPPVASKAPVTPFVTATRRAVPTPPPPPASQHRQPIPAVSEPVERLRPVIRWGPPEPVSLPPLSRMPGARIHQFGQAASGPATIEIPLAAAVSAAPPVESVPEPPARTWAAPPETPLPPLVSMPIAHRPVELEAPMAPVVGRAAQARREEPIRIDEAAPVLRASPPQWKTPEPEQIPDLIDFQALGTLPAEDAAPGAESIEEDIDDAEIEQLLSEAPQDLENLAQSISDEAYADEIPVADSEFDWWGTSVADAEASPALESGEGATLLGALKAIKASGQPAILEIAGLPAVCVIPSRNVYYTVAPAARLEGAITAGTEVSWRNSPSEEEARELSGTQQSRQASLELLSWTASLLTPAGNTQGLADQSVRLKRWPPITESRGRSRFLRYATLLSGAQATPREIAEITGDSVDEIVTFVNACSRMNLLDGSEQHRAAAAPAPVRTAGAGILRNMIEQLTPPKL